MIASDFEGTLRTGCKYDMARLNISQVGKWAWMEMTVLSIVFYHIL
jgi:hypothetical protein